MHMENQMTIPILKSIKETDVVLQSNYLVTANFGNSCSLERKLWSIILSTVDDSQSEFIKFSISLKNLSQLLDIDERNIFNEVDKITGKMMQKYITIFDPIKRGFEKKHLVDDGIKVENGVLSLKIHHDMSYYLLKILPYKENQKAFLSYVLKETLTFKLKYTQPLYLFLKTFQGSMQNGQWFINESLENVRNILGVEKDKYKDWRDFYKRILKSAEDEINNCENALFKIDKINQITNKRTIEKLLFCVSMKSHSGENLIIKAKEIIVKFKSIYDQGLTEKYVLDNFLSIKPFEEIMAKIDLYNKYVNGAKIKKSKSGLFKKLLEENYMPIASLNAEQFKTTKKRESNIPQLANYEERQYTQEDFEKYYKNYDE